jgi:hypothetical protein
MALAEAIQDIWKDPFTCFMNAINGGDDEDGEEGALAFGEDGEAEGEAEGDE